MKPITDDPKHKSSIQKKRARIFEFVLQENLEMYAGNDESRAKQIKAQVSIWIRRAINQCPKYLFNLQYEMDENGILWTLGNVMKE